MNLNKIPIRTKIVATLGPACSSGELIGKLITGGVDVVRLNFAHSTYAEHAQRIRWTRDFSKKTGAAVGILQDLPGPKIRVAQIPGPGLELKRDESVDVVGRGAGAARKTIPISYPRIERELRPGNEIFIADGLIRLIVQTVRGPVVRCRVANGGTVRTGNGVNIPSSSLSLGAFTEEDRRHLAFGLKHGVDFVGISFVGQAGDVERVRVFCRRRGADPFLIAKIERQKAIRNLEEIVDAADGVMVARGDLGVEAPFAEIPGLQKEIVAAARRKGKPVIVATQVLESMIQNPRPTRAEATDIANALGDGTDAIMLSGETAAGRYPLESVAALRQVIEATERGTGKFDGPEPIVPSTTPSRVIAEEACRIARRVNAHRIVVPTRSGATAARVPRPAWHAGAGAGAVAAHVAAVLPVLGRARGAHAGTVPVFGRALGAPSFNKASPRAAGRADRRGERRAGSGGTDERGLRIGCVAEHCRFKTRFFFPAFSKSAAGRTAGISTKP